MATRKLELHNLKTACSIGFYPQEKLAPQTVLISVAVTLPPGQVGADDVAATLNYDHLRDGIQAIISGRHFNLQETLVDDIVAMCFAHAQVAAVAVRTAKVEAYPDCEAACYSVELSRAEWQAGC